MLLRTIIKPKHDSANDVYTTYVVCTNCGNKYQSTSYKSNSIMSVVTIKCAHCGENLNSQELINKQLTARINYHTGK